MHLARVLQGEPNNACVEALGHSWHSQHRTEIGIHNTQEKQSLGVLAACMSVPLSRCMLVLAAVFMLLTCVLRGTGDARKWDLGK